MKQRPYPLRRGLLVCAGALLGMVACSGAGGAGSFGDGGTVNANGDDLGGTTGDASSAASAKDGGPKKDSGRDATEPEDNDASVPEDAAKPDAKKDAAKIDSCTPDCIDRVCGDDGCGGECGSCSSNEVCESGQCSCVPDCTNKDCGSDGCGGSCGTCSSGTCSSRGTCGGGTCGSATCGIAARCCSCNGTIIGCFSLPAGETCAALGAGCTG